MQLLIRYSLTIGSTGLLLNLLSGYGALAQNSSCVNSWVNPKTGKQECLDGNKIPVPSMPQSNTVSSDSVNQLSRSQTFTTLPENQLQTRMPIDSVKGQGNAPAASSAIAGSSGAIPSSDGSSNTPSSFGASQLPYTTSQVLGGTANPAQASPYRRAGKLYMAFGGSTYNFICSASMIGRSLLLTAAHCVHNYGLRGAGWATRVRFVPAKDNASEPDLAYESSQYLISTSYYNGTDTCVQTGVVCNNDIAVVALGNNSLGQQAGNRVGWFGYAWNGYSYAIPAVSFQSVFGNKLFASLSQLGYPGSFDSGLKMQVNTAYGAFFGSGNLKNTWLGSAMTGGSSGGPWLVNFGNNAVGGLYGSASNRNVVVGVTSYGDGAQRMGSSWFGQNVEFPNTAYGTRGAGNIGKLVFDACDNTAIPGWMLQSKGRCS